MLADYPMFMDDIFSAGAICSADDVVKASLVGGDIVKLALVATTILFAILAAAGLPALNWIKV
jgi:glutamate synthase domain-containing protein 2